MVVFHVIGDCPGCGAKSSYGNVLVREYLLRGCSRCKYEERIFLPEIRKRIIYLDQFFFSHTFRGKDERFLAAAERIKQLCRLQLLVAPYSSIHEDETHQWREGREELMEFIKATSRGVKFEKAYAVERAQILRAWTAYLAGERLEFEIDSRDAIRGNLHEWDSYLRVDVGSYHPDIALRRTLKTQAVDGLVGLFDQWQASRQSFEEDVTEEIRGAGNAYITAFLTLFNRLGRGDFQALIDSPISTKIVENMMESRSEDAFERRLQRCREFFSSRHFANVPNIQLQSAIFATLKAMVKRGAYANRGKARERLRGFLDDVSHISLYAPYCHGFVMDAAMAELVSQPNVDLERRYGVRVFSVNNWNELLSWLDLLERTMSEEHKAAVAAAYPLMN